MSHGTNSEDAPLWLILLNKEGSICFFTDTMLCCGSLKRIMIWFLMLHLHPRWTKCINLRCITKSYFLHRLCPILLVCINSDPALNLWNYLQHGGLFATSLLMDHVSVPWVIENSEVIRHTLLISVDFAPTFLTIESVRSSFLSLHSWRGMLLGIIVFWEFQEISVNLIARVVGFVVPAHLELSLKDLLALVPQMTSAGVY